MACAFMPHAGYSYSQHYENTTCRKRGRMDNCPFSPDSHKPTVSSSDWVLHRAGVLGRRGVTQYDNARTNGGLSDV